jgi:hypothetical protein
MWNQLLVLHAKIATVVETTVIVIAEEVQEDNYNKIIIFKYVRPPLKGGLIFKKTINWRVWISV